MANDRILLVCPACRATVMLYKYYPGGGYLNDKDVIEAFIDAHLYNLECNPHACARDLNGNPFLRLVTEAGARVGFPLRPPRREDAIP